MTTRSHAGGCHCGAVRFRVEFEPGHRVLECNCSICRMKGFLHLIVSRDRFHLERGEDALRTYRFGTGVAQHLFCATCGIASYYVPRSHPDGVSVNLRCLDDAADDDVSIEPFDGANWEANVDTIR